MPSTSSKLSARVVSFISAVSALLQAPQKYFGLLSFQRPESHAVVIPYRELEVNRTVAQPKRLWVLRRRHAKQNARQVTGCFANRSRVFLYLPSTLARVIFLGFHQGVQRLVDL